MLTDACLVADVTPRSLRRLVNVFTIMKIIWHHQTQTQEAPDEKLKRACVFLLALCASKSNTLLRRMRAIFDEMEKSVDKPKESNLREFVDKVAGAAVLKSKSINTVLEEVSWEDDAVKWNSVRAHLRMVRCFSFIGGYTESERDDMAADRRKKDDIIAAELKKQDSDHHHAATEQQMATEQN